MHNLSEDSLINLALEQAERINKVTDPDANPVSVWLNSSGTLTISIPNEYHETDYLDENNIRTAGKIDIEEDDPSRGWGKCNWCNQNGAFRKNEITGDWHCMNCGNTQNLTIIPDSTPFPRSLDYEGGRQIYEQNKNNIKTAAQQKMYNRAEKNAQKIKQNRKYDA